ncbi:MAG TPA: dihydrodipicolinate synthase family protein [Actinomycetota bacterium]
MTEPLFTGVGVALATQFDEAGEIDAKATAAHAAALVDVGIRSVVVAGSTGEAAALTAAERVALLTEVRRAVPASIPVIAGTGGPSARQAAALTRDARDAGADAVLALCPPRTNDPRRYYEAVAEAAGDLPALAYHFPQTAPPGIPLEALADLPVQGLKDSSADPERLLAELEVFPHPLWVGAATLLLMAGSLATAGSRGSARSAGAPAPAGAAGPGAMAGAAGSAGVSAGSGAVAGAILAVANVDPEHAIDAFAGDPDAQRALFAAHKRVRTTFPHGLKDAIADRFGTSRVTRLG